MADPPTKQGRSLGRQSYTRGSIQGMMEDVRALVEYAMPSELQLGIGLGPGPGKRRQFKAPT